LRFVFLETVDSTNADARRRVLEGETAPFWVGAKLQTQGRGRRGREWVSVSGNLFCTGVYPALASLQDTAKLSFVAAIAIFETLKAYVPEDIIVLKWPNDVLLDRKKVSGVLLEHINDHVFIGVGINLISHPQDTAYPTTHVLAHMSDNDIDSPEPVMTGPQAVMALLSSRITYWYNVFQTDGFGPVKARWTEHAIGLNGSDITVNLPNESFKARVLGLGENGELQVRLEGGTIRHIHAGDVFLEGTTGRGD